MPWRLYFRELRFYFSLYMCFFLLCLSVFYNSNEYRRIIVINSLHLRSYLCSSKIETKKKTTQYPHDTVIIFAYIGMIFQRSLWAAACH